MSLYSQRHILVKTHGPPGEFYIIQQNHQNEFWSYKSICNLLIWHLKDWVQDLMYEYDEMPTVIHSLLVAFQDT